MPSKKPDVLNAVHPAERLPKYGITVDASTARRVRTLAGELGIKIGKAGRPTDDAP